MTDQPRASVLTHNWETGETFYTPFDGDLAVAHARAFLESEEKRDFTAPDWVWTIVANHAAKRYEYARRMNALLGEPIEQGLKEYDEREKEKTT